MRDSVIERARAYWNGSHWKWWSVLAGAALTLVSAVVAVFVGFVISDRPLPLLLLLLLALIFAVSLAGSGLLESVSGTLNRGGLARESTNFVDKIQSEQEKSRTEMENVAARDRRTIRAGLIVLPMILAFAYFMTQI